MNLSAVRRAVAGAKAESNGRISKKLLDELGAHGPGESKRLRDAALRGTRDAEWGTEIGRLFLDDRCTKIQFEAGKRWGRLVTAYLRAIGAPPPHAKSPSLTVSVGGTAPDLVRPEDAEKVLAMDAALAALAGAGGEAMVAVRSVCESNELPVGVVGLKSLLKGLDRLAVFWGLVPLGRRT